MKLDISKIPATFIQCEIDIVFRKMKRGARLRVICPDLKKVVNVPDVYIRFYKKKGLIGGYDEDMLTHILKYAGFRKIKRVPSTGLQLCMDALR